jgi:hypothetical protein
MTAKVCCAPIVALGCPGVPVCAEALLERMRRTAVSELARHVPEGGLCGCCGELRPCGRARQADLALS